MKKKILATITGIASGLVLAVIVVGNILAFHTYSGALTTFFGMEGTTLQDSENNQYFPRELSSAEEASKKSQEICEAVEEEGAVLLTNNDKALPLKSGNKVSIFSQSSVDFVIGSTGGSGAISASDLTLQTALKNVGIEANPTLTNFYKSKSKYRRKVGGLAQGTSKDPYLWGINEVPINEYTKEVTDTYSSYHDAAIVVISRTGAENADLPTDMASADKSVTRGTTSILELDHNEKDLLKHVSENFDKVIVVLNTTNAFECGFLDEYGVDACLWVGGAGQYGLNAIARLIAGEANPSGKLADTYAYDVFSSPAMQNWGNFAFMENGSETGHHYVTYAEGIYVGYKYYETRYEDKILNRGNAGDYNYDEVVQFPFGYGLSYTDFTWSDFQYDFDEKDETITVSVNVKNTGDVAGKEVVQFYAQSPYTQYDIDNKVEKAAVNLVDFAKTEELDPGDDQDLTMTIPLERLKSYDEHGKGTYILESGDYYFTVADNSHEAINNILKAKGANVDGDTNFVKQDEFQEKLYDKDTTTETEIVNQFEDADGGKKYLSRNDWSVMNNNGLRDGISTGRYDSDGYIYETDITPELKKTLETTGYEAAGAPEEEFTSPTFSANNDRVLIDMKGKPFDDPDWDPLLDQLRIPELKQMVTSSGHKTYGMDSVSKPYATDSDGTSAWKSFIGDGVNAGGMPNETVQASTFNKELEYEVGKIMGELALWAKINAGTATNLTGWYAPAMNLHRTPFGGRNFEYYSEDTYLSALIGSSVVKGATDKGVITYIKHFAFNEQETNRMTNNVTWSTEQALRETYLVPFEMSIKEGGSLGVMTAYPRVGTTWTGGSYNLITNVLRKEWGFNGFVITDYMDGDYENCDQMLAAGGDAALCLEDRDVTTDGAQAQTYMRRAAHHMLYSFVNSNGMNGIDANSIITGGTPLFHRYMLFINICLGTILALCLAAMGYSIFAIYKQKRLVTAEGMTIQEAENKTKIPAKVSIVAGSLAFVIILSSALSIFLTIKKPEELPVDTTPPLSNLVDPNTDLEAKYGQISKKYLTPGTSYNEDGTVASMKYDTEALGYYYEAEDGTLSDHPEVDTNIALSGGEFVKNFGAGDTITFTIESSVTTTALLILSTSSWFNASSLPLSEVMFGEFGTDLDSSKTTLSMDFADRVMTSRNNWDSYSENYIAEVSLYEGTNEIRISAYESFNIDYMCLVKEGAGFNLPAPSEDPIDYETKYGDPDKRILVDGSTSKEFSVSKRGYYYEAESATLSSGVKIENNANSSGGSNIGSFGVGDTLTLEITSDGEADVMLQAATSTWEGAPVNLEDAALVKYGTTELVDLNPYTHQVTPGAQWTNFKESIYGQIHLVKGKNTIMITSLMDLNYDYLKLVNIWDGTPDPEPSEPEPAVDLEEKYGSPSKEVLKDATSTMTFDAEERGYYYEAESGIFIGSIDTEENSSASGGMLIKNTGKGDTLKYEITSTVDTDVLLLVSGSKWASGPFRVEQLISVSYQAEGEESQNMTPASETFTPLPNSWTAFKEFKAGELHLKEGKNTISISFNDSLNVDYIALASPYSGEEPDPDSEFTEKYGEVSKELCTDATESKTFAAEARGYYYEAESALLDEGARIEENNAFSGGKAVTSLKDGRSMEFTINSSVETDVLMLLSGAKYEKGDYPISSLMTVEVTSGSDKSSINYSKTPYSPTGNTWTLYEEFIAGEIHLKAGENKIKIISTSIAVNYDYMALFNPLSE